MIYRSQHLIKLGECGECFDRLKRKKYALCNKDTLNKV